MAERIGARPLSSAVPERVVPTSIEPTAEPKETLLEAEPLPRILAPVLASAADQRDVRGLRDTARLLEIESAGSGIEGVWDRGPEPVSSLDVAQGWDRGPVVALAEERIGQVAGLRRRGCSMKNGRATPKRRVNAESRVTCSWRSSCFATGRSVTCGLSYD